MGSRPRLKPLPWQTTHDKNHTGLSPLRITVICGFVLTSDQVCPKGSMIIGLRIGTYFSHRFGVYSHVFGAIQLSSGSPKHYERYTLHWLRRFKYSVLKLHDSCRNFHSYGSYAMATPFLPNQPSMAYHRMLGLLTCRSPIPSSRHSSRCSTSIHLTFSLTSH